MSPGGRGIHGPRPPFIGALGLLCLCVAGLVLSSCSQLAEAYSIYDTHVSREVVAGHDGSRGSYAEIRLSPHRSERNDGKAVAR